MVHFTGADIAAANAYYSGNNVDVREYNALLENYNALVGKYNALLGNYKKVKKEADLNSDKVYYYLDRSVDARAKSTREQKLADSRLGLLVPLLIMRVMSANFKPDEMKRQDFSRIWANIPVKEIHRRLQWIHNQLFNLINSKGENKFSGDYAENRYALNYMDSAEKRKLLKDWEIMTFQLFAKANLPVKYGPFPIASSGVAI